MGRELGLGVSFWQGLAGGPQGGGVVWCARGDCPGVGALTGKEAGLRFGLYECAWLGAGFTGAWNGAGQAAGKVVLLSSGMGFR